MKKNWFVFALLAVALVFLAAGCEQAEPEVEKAAIKIEPPKLEELTVDPSVLPPPRPAMENAPDLSGAKLVVNDATLEKMSADGVPADAMSALGPLRGRTFTNAGEFAAAVRNALGGSADANLEAIMRNALVISLADDPRSPEGELDIVARQEARQVEVAMQEASEFQIVYFDFDKSNIKPEFQQTIQGNAETLLKDPETKVTIEGHADERGTNEYNLALGQRRAAAIRRALIAEGVPSTQLDTVSFGEERPVALGSNEEAWAKNRRGVMVSN